MSRLTKRFNDNSGYEVEEYGSQYNEVKLDGYFDAVDKLGKLEDLEEEIGCPLEVYVKLIQDTAIFDAKNRLYYVKVIVDNCGSYVVNTIWFNKQGEEIEHSFYLRDYKKLFWLKKDKSE